MSWLVGVVIAFGALLVATVLEGGSPASFINIPAFVIIVGGTFGAAIASFGMGRVGKIGTYLRIAMNEQQLDLYTTAAQIHHFADRARMDGTPAIEDDIEAIKDSAPFMYRALSQVVTAAVGTADAVESVAEAMELELAALDARHQAGITLFVGMGGYAPTMGIIGTVMGLVQALTQLADPSELGHSIATAFIATLLGVASANILWLPLAENLRRKNLLEIEYAQMITAGVLAWIDGGMPRDVIDRMAPFGLSNEEVDRLIAESRESGRARAAAANG